MGWWRLTCNMGKSFEQLDNRYALREIIRWAAIEGV